MIDTAACKWRNVHSGEKTLPRKTVPGGQACICIADQYDSFLKNPDTYFASWSRLVKCLCPVANRKGRITCNPSSGAAKPLRLWTLGLQLSAQQAGGGQSLQPLRGPGNRPITPKIKVHSHIMTCILLLCVCMGPCGWRHRPDQTRPSKRDPRANLPRSTGRWPRMILQISQPSQWPERTTRFKRRRRSSSACRSSSRHSAGVVEAIIIIIQPAAAVAVAVAAAPKSKPRRATDWKSTETTSLIAEDRTKGSTNPGETITDSPSRRIQRQRWLETQNA